MARKSRSRKVKAKPGPDLEAIGLVLVALGVFVLGLLIPALPTGAWGENLRSSLLSRAGWGAYALPWPLLVLGGFFMLRRAPRAWPRVLGGYLVLVLGLWSLLMLVRPSASGLWGLELRALLTGAAGWLAFAPAIIVVTLGLEFIFGWPPTRLLRGLFRRLALGVRYGFKRFMTARAHWRARAAFHADVRLLRKALRELDADLRALAGLYPGSAEVDKWRKVVAASLSSLGQLEPEALKDVQRDVKAWQAAVAEFSRDRAKELSLQLKTEGLKDIVSWAKGFKAQLADAIQESAPFAHELDAIRKALALDATGLFERHRHLLRERDLAEAGLKAPSPQALVRVSDEHQARLAQYPEISEGAAALEEDAALLESWRVLASKYERLLGEFPASDELRDYGETLAQELSARGRRLLEQVEGWAQALASVELRAREDAARGAAHGEELEEAEALAPEISEETEGAVPLEDALDGYVAYAEEAEPDDLPWHQATEAARVESVLGEASEESSEEERQAATPPPIGGMPIQLPGFDLLDVLEPHSDDPAALAQEVRARVRKIDETLSNFGLQGRVVASVRGPTVTRFEVEPAPGEKISRFANLSDDLALAMAVGSVRIEAPIPGKSVIGLEVPNASRDLIRFREAAETAAFRRAKARLPLILGKSIDGEMVIADLARMPHLLIAGSTGSGKSVAVNTLIGSLLYKFLPTELRLLMIDPKMVELTPFDGIPHLLRPVVTNPNDASGVLLGAVAHMERRYKMMSKIGAKNLDQYNEKARGLDMPEMPFIVIVIDELADLMITSPKEVESAIMRLAQMARATGMHLMLATQRPSVDILTSLIKVNVPARMAFAVSSGHDSRTILDSMGAERLIGMGDMLYYQPGMVKAARLQGPFISEAETVKLASFLRRQYFDDEFVEAYGSDFDPPPADESSASGLIDWNDDKLREAAELVISEGQASVSRLQRRLSVGHARAGKLMDSLEALGVVGPHMGSKPRDVLVELGELPDIFGK